jgi:CPA1 family monovalent cation:H+ antiporter
LHDIEPLLLALMVAVAGLSVLARLVRVPYPILLVLGGLVLGFLPGMPEVELPPELVLVAFLPPLLYWAGFFSSPRDLWADARSISLAAVGLVLATMAAVAVAAHAAVDGLGWPAAFALGAIVSPTDPLAATAIGRRLGVPRRLITVLEGESLVNDASALVAYKLAVAAVVSGTFVAWQAGLRFVVGAAGGVAIGLGVGWLIAELRRRLDDPVVEIVISVVSGYAAYLPAELLDVSGVLAAVTTGLYVGWRAPQLASASTRLLGFSFWEVLVYLANAILFILVGLQLQPILSGLGGTAVAVLVRQAQLARRIGARERLVLGWSGMRGAVSLAAALALPLDFPMRNLILFLTFAVILATLVLQGLTLPTLIRRLHFHDDGAEQREELRARLAATHAALDRLDELAVEDWTREDTVQRLHNLYEFRRRRLKERAGIWEDGGAEDQSLAYQRLVRELLQAQRQAIVVLRNQGQISNDVMHRIERELDLEDTRLEI